MSKKKTVLISVNFLAEVPANVVDDPEFSGLDKLENKLSELSANIDTQFKVEWESTHTLVLDPETMNCGKCEFCGCWVSNREVGESIHQLNIAAKYEGQLLCDECLPKDHKLAF